MEYPYFKGLEADRYSFYRVPKALVKADLFQKMSGDAKLLYAVLLDRMSLSIKNGWQDKHGNAYIICTIEEVMDSIHCARQKAVKLLDELEQEFRLIERRRQGLGKPNLLYVKDLYAGLSQSNYWKYENHTSGSLKNELPGVPKSNGMRRLRPRRFSRAFVPRKHGEKSIPLFHLATKRIRRIIWFWMRKSAMW